MGSADAVRAVQRVISSIRIRVGFMGDSQTVLSTLRSPSESVVARTPQSDEAICSIHTMVQSGAPA